MDLKIIKPPPMLSGKPDAILIIDWIIPTKVYTYLDKNKSLCLLDIKICKIKIMKTF